MKGNGVSDRVFACNYLQCDSVFDHLRTMGKMNRSIETRQGGQLFVCFIKIYVLRGTEPLCTPYLELPMAARGTLIKIPYTHEMFLFIYFHNLQTTAFRTLTFPIGVLL